VNFAEISVWCQRRIVSGGHDRRDLGEQAAAERLSLGCESAALVVVESQPPVTEVFAQDAILLDEVVDDLGLLAVDPAGEQRTEPTGSARAAAGRAWKGRGR